MLSLHAVPMTFPSENVEVVWVTKNSWRILNFTDIAFFTVCSPPKKGISKNQFSNLALNRILRHANVEMKVICDRPFSTVVSLLWPRRPWYPHFVSQCNYLLLWLRKAFESFVLWDLRALFSPLNSVSHQLLNFCFSAEYNLETPLKLLCAHNRRDVLLLVGVVWQSKTCSLFIQNA